MASWTCAVIVFLDNALQDGRCHFVRVVIIWLTQSKLVFQVRFEQCRLRHDVWCRRVHSNRYEEYRRYQYRYSNMNIFILGFTYVDTAYACWLVTLPTY